jgi:hypothetical protein
MNEAFLHYIWLFQYFDKHNLQTTENEAITVLRVGYPNLQDGADFQQAQIKIGEVVWAGSVEIHLSAADWLHHKHHTNKNYNNVVLHVVWQHNPHHSPITRADGSVIPTLVLANKVSTILLERYHAFMHSQALIPCEKEFWKVSSTALVSMLDYVLVQRLERKAQQVLDLLAQHTGDWEQTTYQWIGQSFGFKANNEAFLQLAQSIPLKLVQKYSFDLSEIEALLFGQAGFLDELTPTDEYTKNLQIKYNYLRNKHLLQPLPFTLWKFLRLRPANFPTVRIAQFAALLHKQQSLFDTLINLTPIKNLKDLFSCKASPYWQTHYHFGKTTNKNYEQIGTESINNLLINTVAPLLAAYSMQTDNEGFIAKALALFEQLPAEKNHITAQWQELNLPIKTAFDSQASIELYNEYCVKKKCLACRIGKEVLNTTREIRN